jgi:hypothetical protein
MVQIKNRVHGADSLVGTKLLQCLSAAGPIVSNQFAVNTDLSLQLAKQVKKSVFTNGDILTSTVLTGIKVFCQRSMDHPTEFEHHFCVNTQVKGEYDTFHPDQLLLIHTECQPDAILTL